MGTWGVGLFDNDLAADLDSRGELNDYSRDRALDAMPADLERWRVEGSPEDAQRREEILVELGERLRRAKTVRYPL
jgi:hypothetical protein